MHARKVSIQLQLKIPSNDQYTTINLRRHPKSTDCIRGTRMESLVHACNLEGQKYWFLSAISFVTIENKKKPIFHWIFGRSKIFFLLLNFRSQVFNFDTNFLPTPPHRWHATQNFTWQQSYPESQTLLDNHTKNTQHNKNTTRWRRLKESSRPWQKH